MKRFITGFCFFTLLFFLLGCENGSSNESNGDSYTVSVKIINIPEELEGHQVDIVVWYSPENSLISLTFGGIETDITSGDFIGKINRYTDGDILTETPRTYTGTLTCDFEIYIDVDGNGEMHDSGDIADAVTYEGISIDKENNIVEIDYDMLNVI